MAGRLSSSNVQHASKNRIGPQLCHWISNSVSSSRRPSKAPKTAIDVKHIRQHPEIHSQNCVDRHYVAHSKYPNQIIRLFEEWQASRERSQTVREQINQIQTQLQHTNTSRNLSLEDSGGTTSKDCLLAKAKELKSKIRETENVENECSAEIQRLALALPNLSSPETPRGTESVILGYINEHIPTAPALNDHLQIGKDLDIIDFTGAGLTSGWGWYFLKNGGAILEQALIQYSITIALKHGFKLVSPPSMVYSHLAVACGFQPRDNGGEQQIYSIAQEHEEIVGGKPQHCLAGTAEIPLAGMKANTDLNFSDLPLLVVGPSRCYRAEAGSHGKDTRGLFRVHEFTKVELFGWTMPDGSELELFDTIMATQKEILQSLGLRCRILEQPSADLGASATRKQDIEAFFPSRQSRDGGWGEVTSTSICTDYQTRRLATRVRDSSGRLKFPYTVNGTAMAVPRILAALIENHWDEQEACVRVPEVLWPWMHGHRVLEC